MTNADAYNILEMMAIDLTGAMAGMKSTNPMVDVLRQRIDAIDRAQYALIYWDEYLKSLSFRVES